MAQNLSNKSTNGEIFFVSCVVNNKRFKDHVFILDRPTNVYVTKGSELHITKKIYAAKTKLYIIDKKLYTHPLGLVLIKCKIGSMVCFIQPKFIQKPIVPDGTQHENLVIDAINNFILSCGAAINIKLKGDSHLYTDINYAIKISNATARKYGVVYLPKADIVLCKDKSQPVVKGSIFLSHKKGGGASATQQYGGISVESGSNINSRKTVQKFLKCVASILDDVNRLQSNVVGKYKDDILSNLSIFGNEYGGEFSLQHVQAIGQGHVVFKKIAGDNCYELSFTDNISLSGNLSHFNNKFQPVLCARYASGRSFVYNNITYKNVRIGVFPYGKVITGTPIIVDL